MVEVAVAAALITDRQSKRRTVRYIERHKDELKQTDRQTDTYIDRETCRQIHGGTERNAGR